MEAGIANEGNRPAVFVAVPSMIGPDKIPEAVESFFKAVGPGLDAERELLRREATLFGECADCYGTGKRRHGIRMVKCTTCGGNGVGT